MKNNNLHDIMKHSNDVTEKLDNPKKITDLFISVKNDTKLLQLLVIAVDMVVDYINKNK